MKKYIQPILTTLLFLYSVNSFATAYDWRGSTDTSWATASNWYPATGVPSTGDVVTISSHTKMPLLVANTTISQITMSSGTLDCNGLTLTITSTSSFNGGAINNGTVTCSGTSTLTFAGTTFGAAVNATGNSIILNGSKFYNTFTAVKKGTGNDNGSGGNYFSGAVTITDSSSGNLVLSNNSSSPDTFNTTLTVASRSSGSIYLAHQGANNVFNGKVTMYSSSSGKIYSNYYGTAAYNDSIVVNSTSSGGETFGAGTGSCTLASGKTISIGSEGFDHTASGGSWGTLYLRNFVQGNATAINLTLTGSRATIKFESGCVWYGAVTVAAPAIFLDGSRFLSKVNLTYTTASGYTLTSSGGNYFGDTATIVQGNSAVVTMGGTAVDTFATYACLQNTGTTFAINNALFLGNVKFKNSLVSLSDHYYVASTGTVTIKGNATIENANSSINFGNSGGTTVLDTNCRITIPAGSGTVNLTNVVQHGSDTISVPMSAGSDVLYLNTGNLFNGPFLFNGTRILLNGTTFNGTVNILRTYNGATFDICNGGNFFNGNTVICDSVNTSNSNRKFALAGTNPDDFNANVTFKQYASGTGASTVRFYPAYTKNSTFAGNVTVESNSVPIEFGANGGKVIFDGSGTQTLSKTGSYIPSFKRIQVNKSAGIVSLGYPLTLADTLFLSQGVIATDTTNLLTVPDNGIISGGSDSSYIHGPLKKIGNDAFTFALGDTALHIGGYHSLGISAPSNINEEIVARYFASNSGILDTLDSINIDTVEYWRVKHLVGGTSIKFTLGWNSNSFPVEDTSSVLVLGDTTNSWNNYGKESISKSGQSGTIKSSVAVASSASQYLYLTIGSYINLKFSFSSDTINGGDSVHFINNSTGFPNSNVYFWKFGTGCEGPNYDPYVGNGLIECNDSSSLSDLISRTYIDSSNYIVKLSAKFKGKEYFYSKTLVVRPTGSVTFSSCGNHPSGDFIFNGGFEDELWCICSPWDYGRHPYEFNGNFWVPPAVCNWGSTNLCVPGATFCDPPYACVTPDYFMTKSCTEPYGHCGVSPAFVPDNPSGCQPSFNGGNAFVGILCYTESTNSPDSYREFITQQLVTPLVACKVYHLRFRVALAEFSGRAVNGIGAGFSVSAPTTVGNFDPCNGISLTSYIPAIPTPYQIPLTNVMASENWVLVEGYYTAHGGEQYIAIGDFLDDASIAHTNHTSHSCSATYTTAPSDLITLGAYYYIDSVTLRRSLDMELDVVLSQSPTCTGQQNGCVTATVTGGTPVYSYSWSPNIGNTSNICGLAAGTYSVTVTDANGCTKSASVTVETDPAVIAVINSSSNLLCHGDNTGSAHVNASGGTSPYSYYWSPSGGTGATANGLAAGNYTVTVSDFYGCTATDNVTINEPAILMASINTSTDVLCRGDHSGSATVTPGGGTSPYSYYWSPSGGTGATANGLAAGNYTVTVSDFNGCTATDNVTINEPASAISILSTSSTPSCSDNNNNGTVTVSASGGTGTLTYSWSPATGTCPTCTTMTDLSAGTYTVTVVDANGCTATANAIVSAENTYPDPPEIIGPTALCSPDLTDTYTIENFIAQTYTIDVYEIISGIPTHVDVITTSSSTFTYTWPFYLDDGYFVITTAGACQSSDTFYVYHCCDSDPLVTNAWNNTSASIVAPTGYVDLSALPINGDILKINGIFVVDQNLKIYSPSLDYIYMGSGSKIVVLPGFTFQIVNCQLKAIPSCAPITMWSGIEIYKKSYFFMTSSIIHDAENAIKAFDASTYILSDARFDKNFNCIKIPLSPPNNYSTVISQIAFTTFSGTTPLIDPYINQHEWDLNPNAGVVAFNTVNLNINNFINPDPNIVFDHLNYGVIAINSNTNVGHSKFTSIRKTNLNYYAGILPSGIGVYGNSSSSFVDVKGSANGNTFFDCNFGVYLNSSSGSVQDCGMYNVDRGVVVRNNLISSNVLIQHNPIFANVTAIECSQNTVSDINIFENQITMLGVNPYAGIQIIEGGYLHNYSIDHNSIHNGNARFGIQLLKVRTSSVRNNSIFLGSTGELGIYIFGGGTLAGNYIECNFITSTTGGSGFGFQGTHGIHVLSSAGNYIAGNELGFTDQGISCIGLNTGTTLAGNSIQDHRWGVNLFNTYIGQQLDNTFSNGNWWKFNPYTPAGRIGLRAIQINQFANLFHYNPSCSSPGFWTTNNSVVSLFWQNAGGCGNTELFDPSDLNCGIPSPGNLHSLDSLYLEKGDTLVAQDSLLFAPEFNSQMSWASKKLLYEKLKRDTNLLADSLFIDFYNTTKNKSIANFSAQEDSIQELFKIGSENQLIKFQNDSVIRLMLDSVLFNDSLISLSTDTDYIDSLFMVNLLTDSEVVILNLQNDSLAFMTKSAKQSKVSELEEVNQGINVDSSFEENLKAVNAIYLATVSKGIFTFDSTQQSILQTIAELCPLTGGDAVPFARSLYYLINDSVFYLDSCLTDTTDTCTSLPTPGIISGPALGQCGQTGVSYSITPVSGAVSYSWFFDDTAMSTVYGPDNLSAVTVNFGDSLNIVTINVSANNACGSGPPSRLIIKGEPDAPDSISGNRSVCSGDVEYYSTPGSSGASGYNWTFPDDATLLSTNGTSPALILWGSNSGHLSVTASNDCGESSAYSIDIAVNSCRKSQAYNTEARLQAYPNPSKGVISLKFNASEEARYSLFIKDISGRILDYLDSRSVKGVNLKEMDLSNLAKGIYFINVTSNEINETIRIAIE